MADFWGSAADRLENPATDPDQEWAAARRRWLAIARPTQIPPADAPFWLFQGGRGAGKSRSAMEAVSEHCRTNPNARVALVARSFGDARDVLVEGESGLLAILPESAVQGWNRSMGELRLVGGSLLSVYSDTEADRLRGPQFSFAVADELASWSGRECWDNLLLAVRIGKFPQVLVTSTPRPTPLFRELVSDPRIVVVRESTYANLANLAPSFRDSILARFAGTTIGRQEIDAELLLDVEGAMWKIETIDKYRVESAPEDLVRVTVGVDPAGSTSAGSDETGIIAMARGSDQRGYVLADYSGQYTPDQWAQKAVSAYYFHKADAIVIERNFGGDMARHVIASADPKVNIREVTASRGKSVRAEPVSAWYEQGKISHVGPLDALEQQLTTWTPDSRDSPDRLDALTWAATSIMEHLASGPATVATFDPRARPRQGDAVRSTWHRPRPGSAAEDRWDPAWGGGRLFEPPGEAEPPVRRYGPGTFGPDGIVS